MVFDTLSKQLYSLSKDPGRMWLSLECTCHSKSRYSSQSIQEGFNKSMWRRWNEIASMRAWTPYTGTNMDGECPASYLDLLLVVHKLERLAESRDPLLPKTTTTGGSNITQPQALGNLFPSRKQKGNCTFMAQSTIVESIETERDMTAGPGGEEEVESLGEDQKPPVKLVEQSSHSAISSNLPMQ